MTDSSTSHERKAALIHAIQRVVDALEKSLVVICLAGIVILIFSGVLSRYVFHYSIAFTEELSRFLFLWGALLGAASAFKTGEHGGIPLLVNRFGARTQRFFEIFIAVGVTFFLGYLVVMSFGSTMKSYASGQISTTTEIPVWIINFGMLLAFAVGVFRSIQGFLLGAYQPEFSIKKLNQD